MKDRPLLVVTLTIALATLLVAAALAKGGSHETAQNHPYQVVPDAKGGVWLVDISGNARFQSRPGG